MHRKSIPLVVLIAVLSACSPQYDALNSERIKDRFGSYGVAIIEQDNVTRRANLYSVEGNSRICRTYAVVRFVGNNSIDVSAAHNKIVGGASIGSTLRDEGWEIRKESIYIGELTLSDEEHPIATLMQLQAESDLALHAYNLYIDNGSTSAHYATIVETHHPDYLRIAELQKRYAQPVSATAETIAAIRQLVLNPH